MHTASVTAVCSCLHRWTRCIKTVWIFPTKVCLLKWWSNRSFSLNDRPAFSSLWHSNLVTIDGIFEGRNSTLLSLGFSALLLRSKCAKSGNGAAVSVLLLRNNEWAETEISNECGRDCHFGKWPKWSYSACTKTERSGVAVPL